MRWKLSIFVVDRSQSMSDEYVDILKRHTAPENALRASQFTDPSVNLASPDGHCLGVVSLFGCFVWAPITWAPTPSSLRMRVVLLNVFNPHHVSIIYNIIIIMMI